MDTWTFPFPGRNLKATEPIPAQAKGSDHPSSCPVPVGSHEPLRTVQPLLPEPGTLSRKLIAVTPVFIWRQYKSIETAASGEICST